jgi:hypothetical protein
VKTAGQLPMNSFSYGPAQFNFEFVTREGLFVNFFTNSDVIT